MKNDKNTIIAITGFGVSGFVSIAYQILWTRLLTPAVGTVIYAFSSILAFYLFGLAIGSLVYPLYKKLVPQKSLAFGILELGIGISALLPVLILHKFVLPVQLELALRLLPATFLFGLTFPSVISLVDQPKASGQIIGVSYAANTIGAILGGYFANFLFLPYLGSSLSVVLLALVNFILAYVFISREQYSTLKWVLLPITGIAVVVSVWLSTYKNDRLLQYKTDMPILEAKLEKVPYAFLEDEVSSVFARSAVGDKNPTLVIDGVATTHRVSLTKYMAHLPITLHPDPKEVLVIAFGMGNSYRSSIKHGINTTAVELVPSVPKTAYLFHKEDILTLPQGKIVINDGRNFAFLAKGKYDIVIIDPPPPFNVAGSTVLHSREFYQDLAKILTPNGIVSQWIYAYSSRQDDISMAMRTFLEVFPHVVAIQKSDSPGGIFMEGSFQPIQKQRLDGLMKNPIVLNDLLELKDKEFIDPQGHPLEIVGDRDSLMKMFAGFPLITDANPRTEYYLIRHRLTTAPSLSGKDLDNFVQLIKSAYVP